MEITGKIIAVLDARSGVSQKGNSWMSQEYVIETIEQYPKKCVFNVFGEDKIKEFGLQIGLQVTVSFDINAREYNGRWYNDVRAWKVEAGNNNAQQPITPAVVQPTPPPPTQHDAFTPIPGEENLPF